VPIGAIVVGPRAALPGTRVTAGEVNWLIPAPVVPIRVQVKLRGREAPRDATAAWDAEAGLLRVTLDVANVVAPGQACVLYDAVAPDRMLGGGWIVRGEAAFAA
jgi:tRNA-specific 2-thiouridylase